jgi:hypothetical protein
VGLKYFWQPEGFDRRRHVDACVSVLNARRHRRRERSALYFLRSTQLGCSTPEGIGAENCGQLAFIGSRNEVLNARRQPPPQPVQFNLRTTLGIQQALNYLKVPTPPLTEDGLMGPLTRAAVQLFQGRNALAVDGIVGPSTRAALQTTLLRAAQQAA